MDMRLVDDSAFKQRFTNLWERCLLPGTPNNSEEIFAELVTCYTEPHRHYHDRTHLAHSFEQLDQAINECDDPDSVELAIWFHDAINDPGAKDNEQRSIEFFLEHADGVLRDDIVDRVADMILYTTHTVDPTYNDERLVCDIDLASFGCEWDIFLGFSDAVKAEFTGSEEDYSRREQLFLHSMLQRPKIFLTDFFNQRYEEQARENIQRLLTQLNQAGNAN